MWEKQKNAFQIIRCFRTDKYLNKID
jgi:hypothetical protein